VLVRAADRELRSVASLYAALQERAAAGEVTITIVRGVDTELRVTVDLRADPGDELAPLEVTGADHAGTHQV